MLPERTVEGEKEFSERERHRSPPPAASKKLCDICFAKNESANRVCRYNGEHLDKFSSLVIEIDVQRNGETQKVTFKPFKDAIERAGDREVNICRQCERQLKTICFPKKKDRAKVAKFQRYIWNRLQKYRQSEEEEESDTSDTIVSKKCYLHLHTSLSNGCADPVRNLSCPLYLAARKESPWKIERWITEFSKRMGVGTSVSEEIATNAQTVKLCQVHYAAMRNTMMIIEADAKACSICGNTGDRRYAGEVTKFPFDEMKGKEDIIAVVEDALSVLTDNKIQPKDVKNICSPCRLVVLGRVTVKSMDLRSGTSGRLGFDYGPTENVVLSCIRYLREQLWEKKRMFVKLQEVHSLYLDLVSKSNCHDTQLLHHKDVRTLRKYLQPPLAQTEIHLELGAKKVGSFVCTLRTFRDIASTAKRPTINDASITPKTGERCSRELQRFIESRKDEIEKGEWDIV